jgi:hypothetical protein
LITFSDIPSGLWAEDYIYANTCAGITTGYPDGTYRPENAVNRAQMAVFIIKALFGDTFEYSEEPHFTDVPQNHWAFRYVQRMYDEGIATGYGDDTYRPENAVNRAQAAVFIIKALYGNSFEYSEEPHFIDVSGSHWAFRYIQMMYDEMITTRYPDGTYRPENTVNRSQMAVFAGKAFLSMR